LDKHFLAISALLLLVIYLIAALLLYIFQRNMLYFASPAYEHNLKTIELINDKQTLKVNVLNAGRSKAIIYFGGNAEAVIFNEKPFAQNFPEQTTYLVNYRGYGGSSGEPTEENLYSDALAIYDHIRHEHDSVSVLGRSLGSGVATYLASKREIDYMALVTPYDSIQNVAQARLPIFPVGLLIRDRYDSARRATNVSSKVLIVMAELDAVIPNSHSIKLEKSFAKEQVSSVKIKDANHNNLSAKPEYFSILREFFNNN